MSCIHLLSPVLNILTDSACLTLIGRLLNDLAALHRKLSIEISKLDLLVGFSCPLFACLVLKLYSVENMEKRYLGYVVEGSLDDHDYALGGGWGGGEHQNDHLLQELNI